MRKNRVEILLCFRGRLHSFTCITHTEVFELTGIDASHLNVITFFFFNAGCWSLLEPRKLTRNYFSVV